MLLLPRMVAQAAYDASGAHTKALTGFAAKSGVAVEDVRRVADAKGVEYIWATRKQAGRAAAEVTLLACFSCYSCILRSGVPTSRPALPHPLCG
jgi:hypothetical protein